VVPGVYQQLVTADSLGHYFLDHIDSRYVAHPVPRTPA
jgi:hypothetical protein